MTWNKSNKDQQGHKGANVCRNSLSKQPQISENKSTGKFGKTSQHHHPFQFMRLILFHRSASKHTHTRMWAHANTRAVLPTHWGPQWSPWRSSRSWGRSLCEIQIPGRWSLSRPQNRTSRWSRALSSPASAEQGMIRAVISLHWAELDALCRYSRRHVWVTLRTYLVITVTPQGRVKCCCVCRCIVCVSHQPLWHGCFVLSGKVLLQRQDDAVGDDGGEDHVLKWSGRL